MDKTFGSELKRARELKKIRPCDFARLIGWSTPNLSNIERGTKRPPDDYDKIHSICDHLGMLDDPEFYYGMFDLAASAHKTRIPADVRVIIQTHPAMSKLVRGACNGDLKVYQ